MLLLISFTVPEKKEACMNNLALEIRNACEKKIAMLQQEIERLREGMKTVIDALQENNGGDQELNPPVTTGNNLTQRKINHPITKTDVDVEPNTRHRMLLAIDKMPLSGFGTAALLKAINNDGNPKPVNKNRALRILNDLIHSGLVKVITKRVGSQGGVYSKYYKETATTESSPATMQRTFFPEDEKGQGEHHE
jgi:hypothetical protein